MAETETDEAIRLNDVRVDFGKTRLHFDCSIRKSEIVAVTGASGSGKSTFINLVAGFEMPDKGDIAIFGKSVLGQEAAARPTTVIFQEHNLFSHLDVATNVGLGIDPGLRLGVKERSRIAGALLRVGLEGFGRRMPPTLSGGERQRVALARALVRRRPILLLDEPFAALDPGLRSGMAELLAELHREENNTILLVTHHPEDIRKLADSVIFLAEGGILVHEPATRFLERREPAAIAGFLGK